MQDMRKWLLLGGAVCLVAVLSLTAVLFFQTRRARAAEHTLAEATLAALSGAAEEVQGLALAMDKLGIAVSTAQQATLLHESILRADLARHSLSLLPAGPQATAPLLSWLSRFSDAAGMLLSRLGSGLPVTDGELSGLAAARADLRLLHAELQMASTALLEGQSLAEALPPTEISVPPTAAEIAAYRALPSREVGSGEALQIAKEFVGIDRVVSVAPASDTSGALPTYGITVRTADVQLSLEITRRGGKVLLMSPETAGFPVSRTVDECRTAAAAFLTSHGFASMSPAWEQVYDGLCVLTFVHEQEGALVWSDRVTVQVRMDTAEIVGMEARSYWQNHIPRKLGEPLLTAEEASSALSPLAHAEAARLAVIPAGMQERLCWQFTLSHNGDRYISFIDATTGRELLLEKVMSLENGAIPA